MSTEKDMQIELDVGENEVDVEVEVDSNEEAEVVSTEDQFQKADNSTQKRKDENLRRLTTLKKFKRKLNN